MTTKVKNIVVTCLMAVLFGAVFIICLIKPTTEYSDSERRVLATLPELTLETIWNGEFMSGFEEYTQDQFPLRDTFRTIKALSAKYVFHQADNNDVYLEDGYVSKLDYPLNDYMITNAAEKFRFLYDSFMKDTGVNVFFSIIPDKNYFLAGPNGYPSIDYEKLVNDAVEQTEDFMTYVDIFPLLSIEDYYYTDTHWRQERITDVAEKLLNAMGAEYTGEYTENTLGHPFNGVYVGQSALPLEPDTIKYLTSGVLDGCTVTYMDDMGMMEKGPVYVMEKATGKDPYDMFLSGAVPLVIIDNPNAVTDKEMVIFRDSFGSSITPLLVEGYAKITVVDIRYIQSNFVGSFVKFTDQDVLFLYSTMLLNSSVAFK